MNLCSRRKNKLLGFLFGTDRKFLAYIIGWQICYAECMPHGFTGPVRNDDVHLLLVPGNDIVRPICNDLIQGPADNPTMDIVDLKQAIQSFTINAAYQHNLDDVTGSLEAGKSAEIVILDHDLESLDVYDIAGVKVVETIFQGKTVYHQ